MTNRSRIINQIVARSEPIRERNKTIRVAIYACPVCGMEVDRKTGLRGHLLLGHPEFGAVSKEE